MARIRALYQFLFGLQALTFAAVLLGVGLVARFQNGRGISYFHELIPLACLWQILPTIAWWKLRTRKPNARWWAAAASALALPIPMAGKLRESQMLAHSSVSLAHIVHIPVSIFDLAMGVAGLLFFLCAKPAGNLPRRRIAPLPSIDGDGTSPSWQMVLQFLSGAAAFTMLFATPFLAVRHNIQLPTFGARLALIAVAVLIEITLHESGHLLAGCLSGYRLRRLHIGPFLWFKRNGRWRFEFSSKAALGGSVGMATLHLNHFRRRTMVMIAGGPTASFITSVIAALALSRRSEACSAPGWYLLAMLSTASAFSFVMNLIPQRTKLFYSDGAQLFQLAANGPWGKVHLAMGMATTSLLTDIRPRDWDIQLINEAAAFLKTGVKGMTLQLLASHYYLDAGQISEAVVRFKAGEMLFDPAAIRKVQDFYSEFVFVNAVYGRDLAAAERWWLKLQALENIDLDADYWKARSAILWLQGRVEEAREAWQHANENAQKLPSCGIYNFTRSQVAVLRKILDHVDDPVRSETQAATV